MGARLHVRAGCLVGMHRAFISLYLLIVASVVAVGWGLDELWSYVSPDEVVTQQEKDLITLIAANVNNQSQSNGPEYEGSDFDLGIAAEIKMYSLDDFANSSLKDEIEQGDVTAVNARHGDKKLYKLIDGGRTVLEVTFPPVSPGASFINQLLIVVFYAAIALAVFFWVWPLSRDLRKLEIHTKWVGKDDVPAELHFSHASPVFDLANAFNNMSRRIKALLASYQEMTNAVSHELRTPLARMKFGLEIAEQTQDVARLKKQIGGLKEDVSEMESLVGELLTYAGFEQGNQKLSFQSGDLSALLEQLIDRLSKTGRLIEFHVEDKLDGSLVRCEWHLMERAIFNVLQNAVRFAEQKVDIFIDATEKEYRLVVDDDGPGIPEEDRLRVLQSFVRLNNQVNSEKRGFGLGLAIVNRILSWHQGRVCIEASPAGGARLILRWPTES